ncbi:MAG: AAA family ATPase, partial [Isosphaeraceae bacterium]
MRIDRLDLRAFGPFTDVSLDLSAGQHGLHLIYGPNEAGKSSALRALRQMLYGIDARTPDNFVHEYDKLRVGATLRNPDGTTLAFLRRKGNRRTLRSAMDDADLDDAALNPFLGRLEKDRFETLFGIDHERLAEGGKAIASGKGHLGQLIFGAGSDLVRLRKLQKELETGWSDLFKKGGQKPPLNQALAELAEARQAIEDASIRSADWAERTASLAEAHRLKVQNQSELDDLQRQTSRLERIHQAKPDLAQRLELLAALTTLADVPLLRDDFAEERRTVQEDIRVAEQTDAMSRDELKEIEEALGAIDVPEPLLVEAEAISELQLQLGGHQKDQRAMIKKRADHQTALDSARGHLRELGHGDDLSQAESLRITTTFSRRFQSFSDNHPALVKDCESSGKTIDVLTEKIDALSAALDNLETDRDPVDLRAAVDRATRKGDLHDQAADARKALKKLERQAEDALRKLPLWSGTLEDLEGLIVPGASTINRYLQELDDANA